MRRASRELKAKLQETILHWYEANGRSLPWRKTTDPYHILVSEVMLQQTQAERVIVKYEAWLDLFPTLTVLAKAPLAEVIRAWTGLGYNRRALYLQKAARAIDQEGQFPHSVALLEALPGIGPYTAAAICAFAYNQDVVLIDTNIKRFYQLIHFGEIDPPVKELATVATFYLPRGQSRAWHNALMDIGAIISKERGALAEQIKLISLFPVLEQFNLPTLSNSPLKRAKQSRFRFSRRFWRGRIIELLRTEASLSEDRLIQRLTEHYGQPNHNLMSIISDLIREGFLVKKGRQLALNESDL